MNILITSVIDLKRAAHSRLHEIIRHLPRNYNITVLGINDTWKARQADVRQYQSWMEETLENSDIRYLTRLSISPYLQEVFSGVLLRKILKELDCARFDVHLNYGTLLSGYFVARRLKTLGINTIYDIADDLPQMIRNSPQIPAPLRLSAQLLGRLMVKQNIRLSRKVIGTVSSFQDYFHIPPDKFELIPNGVDVELFQNCSPQRSKQKLGLNGCFVVGYSGVLREWIDLEPVFTAVQTICQDKPDVRMLIVGEEGGLERNRCLSQKYDIVEKVLFTGTVAYGKLPEYIAAMDVCVVPMKDNPIARNALPLKLFEYMACQKPVICPKLDGIYRAAGDKVLYASSHDDYRKHLLALYDNRELRERMGVEGKELVRKHYRWDTLLVPLEEILMELGGKRQSNSP